MDLAPPVPPTRAAAGTATGGRHLALLYVVFFLSGFSALVYQIAWQRMLGLFGGSDVVAATIVVGAFLFGLGLGSLWGAAVADRLSARRAVQAFALCELGIAGFALLSRWLFYDVLFGELIALAQAPGFVLAAVFLALLPPTVLMGLSLPLLSKAVVDRIETASSQIGRLYGVNTLGAGAGALLAGFVIIGTFGYEIAVYLGALLNLAVGAGALVAATRLRGGAAVAVRASPPALRGIPGRIWLWSLLVFLSGFLIISLEIVWFRVLGLLMQTNAYAFSLVLAVFLVGDALGILVGARLVRGIADPRHVFHGIQGAAALYALASLGLIWLAHGPLDGARWFVDATAYAGYGPGAGKVIRLLVYGALTTVAVLPPAFLLGLSFPITQKAVQDDPALVGQRVGIIQLFNILGNTAGAVVTGLVLLHGLGTAGTLRLVGVAGLLFVAALLVEGRSKPYARRRAQAALAAALAVAILAFPANAPFWARLHGTSLAGGALVAENRTGVAVLRPFDDKTPHYADATAGHLLYIGGHAQSRVPFWSGHGALGILGALVHPEPRAILVIGHGTGGTPYASSVDPSTERIRVVEIVQPVFDVMRAFARAGGGIVERLFADARFEHLVADGRHVLFTDPQRFDVIQADAILPRSSHSGLLYSVEFFRQVRARLNPGGLSVQWAPTERTVATFRSVFPHGVQVGPVLLGSEQPIAFTLDAVAERLRGAAHPHVAAAGWDPDAMLAWLSDGPVQVWTPADPPPGEDVNTDLFPRDEYFLNARKIRLFGTEPAPSPR